MFTRVSGLAAAWACCPGQAASEGDREGQPDDWAVRAGLCPAYSGLDYFGSFSFWVLVFRYETRRGLTRVIIHPVLSRAVPIIRCKLWAGSRLGHRVSTTMVLPHRSLQRSLNQLRDLRFHRLEACEETVRAWFKLRKSIDQNCLAAELWRVHDWLISPLTLQALDYEGLAAHLVDTLQKGKDFDADLILLLTLIEEPPSAQKIAAMKRHEEAVAEGHYDTLTKEPKRYQELEIAMRSDPLLLRFWTRIKQRYARQFRRNDRGVMRRTMARERGFDSRREFKWGRKRDRFQITFDALCHRWCLYGFENESPLALKLTANPTAHGTMIFVPRGMSLAASGTFLWKAISEIHKAHGASRQGEKLFEIRMQNRKDREVALKFDAEARRLGYRGLHRVSYTLQKMGKPLTKARWLKRLLYGA